MSLTKELIRIDESQMASDPITLDDAVKNVAIGSTLFILFLEVLKRFTGNRADTKIDKLIKSLRFISSTATTVGTIIK